MLDDHRFRDARQVLQGLLRCLTAEKRRDGQERNPSEKPERNFLRKPMAIHESYQKERGQEDRSQNGDVHQPEMNVGHVHTRFLYH